MRVLTKSAVALAAASILILGGCSADAEPAQQSDRIVDEDARALLPQSIIDSGVIAVVTDPSHPPFEFIDENDRIVGINAELAQAVAEVLGVEIVWETTDFAGLITGISSKRYDASIVAMFDTTARQEQIDFVDNYIDALKIIVPEGNPLSIVDLPDFCGRTISTLQGSVMLDMLEEYQSNCSTPMEITVAATTSEQLLWLDTGRADASIANGTVTQYSIDQRGASGIEVVHENSFMENYYGWGIHKDNVGLRDAFVAALNILIADGTYAEILTKWGASDANHVEEAIVNGGGTL